MANEISGRIHQILQPVTGQGKNGEWKKREFVIETQAQYPKKVMFSLWGDRTEQINSFQNGDQVKVSFDPESREYNGRWYTELRAWRVERATAGGDSNAFNQERPQNYNQEPPVAQANSTGGSTINDDLPF